MTCGDLAYPCFEKGLLKDECALLLGGGGGQFPQRRGVASNAATFASKKAAGVNPQFRLERVSLPNSDIMTRERNRCERSA